MRPPGVASEAAAVLERAEANSSALFEFLAETVRVPSVTGSEGKVIPLYEQALGELGLEVKREIIDKALVRDICPAFEHETNLKERPNVIARLRTTDGDPRALVLNGHVDVVPPGNQEDWIDSPFSGTVRQGRLYGRGAADMKAGLAAGIFALRALVESGIPVNRDVEFQCVVGEETGGIGTAHAALSPAPVGAAVFLEPTGGAVCTVQGGFMRFELQVAGRAAHPSVPWTGVNAFEKVAVILERLKDWAAQKDRNHRHPLFADFPEQAPFVVTTVRAGDHPGSVPASGVVTARIGYLPGQRADDVRDEIEALMATLAEEDPWLGEHPPVIHWPLACHHPWETSASEPLVGALLRASEAVGCKSKVTGTTGVTDASHMVHLREVPTVVFGPGRSADAHRPNESVELEQLTNATKVLAIALLDYLSSAKPKPLR